VFCSPQPICLDYVNLKISRYAHHFGVLCRAALKLKGRSCRTAGVGGPCENMVPPKQKCLFITLQPPSSIYIYKISIYIYILYINISLYHGISTIKPTIGCFYSPTSPLQRGSTWHQDVYHQLMIWGYPHGETSMFFPTSIFEMMWVLKLSVFHGILMSFHKSGKLRWGIFLSKSIKNNLQQANITMFIGFP